MSTPFTIQAVRQARRAGATWRVRVEHRGRNPKNKSGYSYKFWEASGEGYGSVTISWGRIGSTPRRQVKSFAHFEKKLDEKLYKKGYGYVPGSQEVFEAPRPKPAPLTGPFALIKALRAIPDGFLALDASGVTLFEVPQAGGFSLRETYGIPVVG
jgi:predicted DNA-binding WGR domain protein